MNSTTNLYTNQAGHNNRREKSVVWFLGIRIDNTLSLSLTDRNGKGIRARGEYLETFSGNRGKFFCGIQIFINNPYFSFL